MALFRSSVPDELLWYAAADAWMTMRIYEQILATLIHKKVAIFVIRGTAIVPTVDQATCDAPPTSCLICFRSPQQQKRSMRGMARQAPTQQPGWNIQVLSRLFYSDF